MNMIIASIIRTRKLSKMLGLKYFQIECHRYLGRKDAIEYDENAIVMVENIPPESGEDQLYSLFNSVATLRLICHLVTRDGKSYGVAYIQYYEVSSCRQAVRQIHGGPLVPGSSVKLKVTMLDNCGASVAGTKNILKGNKLVPACQNPPVRPLGVSQEQNLIDEARALNETEAFKYAYQRVYKPEFENGGNSSSMHAMGNLPRTADVLTENRLKRSHMPAPPVVNHKENELKWSHTLSPFVVDHTGNNLFMSATNCFSQPADRTSLTNQRRENRENQDYPLSSPPGYAHYGGRVQSYPDSIGTENEGVSAMKNSKLTVPAWPSCFLPSHKENLACAGPEMSSFIAATFTDDNRRSESGQSSHWSFNMEPEHENACGFTQKKPDV